MSLIFASTSSDAYWSRLASSDFASSVSLVVSTSSINDFCLHIRLYRLSTTLFSDCGVDVV